MFFMFRPTPFAGPAFLQEPAEPIGPHCHHRQVSDTGRQGLGEYEAAALVAGSSAAVLVVELTSLRLLAPFLGLTLETSTIVIGTALAAIAVGSWSTGSRRCGRSVRCWRCRGSPWH